MKKERVERDEAVRPGYPTTMLEFIGQICNSKIKTIKSNLFMAIYILIDFFFWPRKTTDQFNLIQLCCKIVSKSVRGPWKMKIMFRFAFHTRTSPIKSQHIFNLFPNVSITQFYFYSSIKYLYIIIGDVMVCRFMSLQWDHRLYKISIYHNQLRVNTQNQLATISLDGSAHRLLKIVE